MVTQVVDENESSTPKAMPSPKAKLPNAATTSRSTKSNSRFFVEVVIEQPQEQPASADKDLITF